MTSQPRLKKTKKPRVQSEKTKESSQRVGPTDLLQHKFSTSPSKKTQRPFLRVRPFCTEKELSSKAVFPPPLDRSTAIVWECLIVIFQNQVWQDCKDQASTEIATVHIVYQTVPPTVPLVGTVYKTLQYERGNNRALERQVKSYQIFLCTVVCCWLCKTGDQEKISRDQKEDE